jgi:D-2-hydroxyacid dehydrogenase (NADP+)
VARALSVCQRLPDLARAQQNRRWERTASRELRGSRVLIAGTGAIGRAVAMAFGVFGCDLVGCSESGSAVAPFRSGVRRAELREVVSEADFLVVSVPLTEKTHHMFDGAILSACRGAYLINIARGKIVDQAALFEALDHRHLSGAALDVFETEPLPADSPLWGRPEVAISPHIAALTKLEEARESFLANLEDLAQGRAPRTRVDVQRGY